MPHVLCQLDINRNNVNVLSGSDRWSWNVTFGIGFIVPTRKVFWIVLLFKYKLWDYFSLLTGRIHQVLMLCCACEKEICSPIRWGLWPWSPDMPSVAYSFEILELFHYLNVKRRRRASLRHCDGETTWLKRKYVLYYGYIVLYIVYVVCKL